MSRIRVSGAAIAAALSLTAAGCSDSAQSPADPGIAVPSQATLERMGASSGALADAQSRLAGAVHAAADRARLTRSIEELSVAMTAGNVAEARRALVVARGTLKYVDSDADRDALGLALDAAAESLATPTP